MRIINLTRSTTLAENAMVAEGFLARLIGLLNKQGLEPGQGLVLKPCNSIHTFFMRFSIDVVFVDKENRVIKAIPNLNPFQLTYIYFRAKLAIELPLNTIFSSRTTEGDMLSFL